jgi:transcriptional regulator with XRE-family HTH domain
MVSSYSPDSALGAIIRQQRELAELSLRQLASAVGISNPYLSQIERGLRSPSETVLNAIADSLLTTAEALHAQAGQDGGQAPEPDAADDAGPAGLERAIEQAGELTAAQRRALRETYRAFVDANALRRRRPDRPGQPRWRTTA